MLWRATGRSRFEWAFGTVTAVYAYDHDVYVKQLPWPWRLVEGWQWDLKHHTPAEAGHSYAVTRWNFEFRVLRATYGCLHPRQPWVRIQLWGSGKATCTTNHPRTASLHLEVGVR